jgi:two-component system response regulator RegA
MSLLVVDDDDVFRGRVVQAFCDRGFHASGAASVSAALEQARDDPPELAVIDLRLRDGSGLDVVTGLMEIDPQTRIVVLTGYGSIATAVDAMRRGATNYLTKPADVDDIVRAFDGVDAEAATAPADVAENPPSLARVEWEHLQRVMSDADGNISLAARRLGLHRRSLQRKLLKDPMPR